MFSWIRKKSARLEPEARWIVDVGDDFLGVTDQTGQTAALAKSDLTGLLIETNDSGPWGADLWWLLFGEDDELVCGVPQGATNEGALIDYLSALPGFDHGQMIDAMGSTQNAVFPIWRRSS